MNTPSERDILHYIGGADDASLFQRADTVRRSVFGDEVYLRGIVEFSNVCNKNCQYCGLRAHNRKLKRYRMTPDEIVSATDVVAREGLGTVVLQSGDDFSYSARTIGDIISRIKDRHDIAVTLSLGDRGLDEYAYWRDCGADRALLKLETGHVKLYERLRCGESFQERLHRIEGLKRLGYEVGSGIIVGLPDTDILTTVRDMVLLSHLELDMIAIGPFVPSPATPLAFNPAGDVELSLRVSAIMRILCPQANIPATSALDALLPGGRQTGLLRGCNVVMPSLTPEHLRSDYAIYPGKNMTEHNAVLKLNTVKESIARMGLVPSQSKGSSPRRHYVDQSAPRRPSGDYACRTAQCG
ncbi:[FeFe] hydrogenase H-cluster radical SAM maturase HydE [Salidesulfovibrio brasiliensis]|uniref:[FeFe] hydrogenase H-cluster radical SAM maturase HydE n=1 Tax=Salidesulfovibrio brasiliensis TaxID=221711 RepID=UPI000B1522CD|nr:[FeFe] hydrogenase H-cluster radical SAM maturase HydE [Salidesulfovibrio brasiliensis]